MDTKSYAQFHGQTFAQAIRGNSPTAHNELAEQNRRGVQTLDIPKDVHIPTGDEIRTMKQWEFSFSAKNPKASPREVRRAVNREFNIVVFGGQTYFPNPADAKK
jgi:thiamine pyrophosphate-dependent acetolactate synthase large subunit-like protein